MSRASRGRWLLAGCVACSCGGQSEVARTPSPVAGQVDGGGDVSAPNGDGSSAESLFYGPCPPSFATECAYVPLPLDWSQPDGQDIDVMVAHQPAAATPGVQLWLLAGGPGESGEVFAPLLGPLSEAMPDAEIFVLEHRGVGESERLGCPAAASTATLQEQWQACADAATAEWGTGLADFNTTNAARDLQTLISRTRIAGRPVIVAGVSYGTYLALRFLELFPTPADGADAVFLDSVVAPGTTLLSLYDEWPDLVGPRLGAMCAADATCGAKMGADPWQAVSAAAANPCPAVGLSPAAIGATMAVLIQSRSLMGVIFPLAYRLKRCTPEDAAAVGYLAGTISQLVADSPPSPRESGVLKMQIALSELWETPRPSAAELQARCDDAVICPGFGPVAAVVDSVWPHYAEPLAGAWPLTSIPILAIHGELDSRAPLELATSFSANMTAPGQQLVPVPNSIHSVMLNSPLTSGGGGSCGLLMLQSFVESRGSTVDSGCLSNVAPINLAATGLGPDLFGRSDAWENEGDASVP